MEQLGAAVLTAAAQEDDTRLSELLLAPGLLQALSSEGAGLGAFATSINPHSWAISVLNEGCCSLLLAQPHSGAFKSVLSPCKCDVGVVECVGAFVARWVLPKLLALGDLQKGTLCEQRHVYMLRYWYRLVLIS